MTESTHPLETALATTLKRLLQWGVPMAILALILKSPGPDEGLLAYSVIHLLLIEIAVLVLISELAPLLDTPWFPESRRSWLASGVSLVALVTGFAALLMLATAAAGRYDPSMQFLQLLSAMDIAWVTAALFFGARKLWGTGWAWLLGALIVLACVASIAAYLNAVGFSTSGGWIVDSQKMMTIVIPADMAAAIVAIAVLLAAGWPVSQPTEQRRPQS